MWSYGRASGVFERIVPGPPTIGGYTLLFVEENYMRARILGHHLVRTGVGVGSLSGCDAREALGRGLTVGCML